MKKTTTEAKGIALTYAPAQQQNNRFFAVSDLFMGIIAALVVISCGGVLISLLDIDVYGIVLFAGALLSMGCCVLFARCPRYRKWLAMGASILFLLLLVFGGKDGFALFFNGIKDLYGMALSRIYLPYAVSSGCNEPFAATVFLFMFTMAFSVIVAYMLFAKSKVTCCFVFLFLPFLLIPAATPPHWLWYMLLVISLALSVCARISGSSVNSGAGSVLVFSISLIGAVLVFAGLFALVIGFEKPMILEHWETTVAEDFNEMRYGRDKTNNFPEGDLVAADSFRYFEDTALEITMTEPQSLYLRGYVGSEYTESGWETVDKVKLYEYADLFYWLHEGGFFGTSQIASAVTAVGADAETVTVTVENVNAKREYIYAPYELIDSNRGNAFYRIGDTALKEADWEDPASVTYTMVTNQVRNAGELAETLRTLSEAGDEDVIAYLEKESAYRDFVYATSLDIPEEVKTVLQTHLGEADVSEGHGDYSDIIQKIYDVLLLNTTYNEDCGSVPDDADFLRYFLETSAEGYSVHYATAATLMLRYCGVPARYVEGYIVTPEDVSVAAGSTIAIDGGNAHAWVEYYRDGVGWIPLEVTPPYLFIMEQPGEIQSLVSDTLDQSSGQSGMVQMEEDNYEDIEEEDKKPQEEDSVSLWRIVVSIAVIAVWLLVVAIIVLILRRRKSLRAHEKRIEDADPREGVDLLFRDALKLLFIAGIREENDSLDRYIEPLKEDTSSDIHLRYKMFCKLHREARFSDHPISPERKRVFYLFRKEAEQYARNHSRWLKRLIDQYIHLRY